MVLPDTYSRRKRSRAEQSDPLRYDDLPQKVRMQFLHIFEKATKLDKVSTREDEDKKYQFLVNFFREELGLARLAPGNYYSQEFTTWFLAHGVIDELLDAIELSSRMIEFMAKRSEYANKKEELNSLIPQLNARLLEAGIGYQFESNQLIQADSRYLHAETVVPALTLLSDLKYAGANHEFLDAHKAFRVGDFETALVESCKAFESVLKVIAAEKGWGVDENAPARKLVQAAINNDLIPKFLDNEFTGLRLILENGIGMLRNKAGGHGAGGEVREVPRHLAAFQLHQTAAAIILLIEAAAAK